MRHNFLNITFAFAATIMAARLQAQDVRNTSYTLPSGERILRHEVVVDATLQEVWAAWTTSEGLRSFAAPIAVIDFRMGGLWEASYRLDAKMGDTTIVNEIIGYVPIEMLAIRIRRTPPGFPHPEVAKQLWTVMQFQELEPKRVRVVISMCGWKEGPEWDAVYQLFEKGNAKVSAWLYKRFEAGPIDWTKELQPPKGKK